MRIGQQSVLHCPRHDDNGLDKTKKGQPSPQESTVWLARKRRDLVGKTRRLLISAPGTGMRWRLVEQNGHRNMTQSLFLRPAGSRGNGHCAIRLD
jgi:hypothetical protein